MYQTIHEKIRVAGVYHQAQFKPVWFDWNQTQYKIKRLTLISDIKDGGVKKRAYAVQVGSDIFRLVFNRETEVWYLEEVWMEG